MKNLACLPSTLRRITIHHSAAITFFNPLRSASVATTTATTAPPPPPVSYLPTPSNNPDQAALPAAPLPTSALEKATKVFTQVKPQLLFTCDRFLRLPFNTRVPEICLLGRSNVGKSTLLNALAGAPPSKAGSLHEVNARRLGLAITSKNAGCTKTLNGYGFGIVDPEILKAFLAQRRKENEAAEKLPTRTLRREYAKAHKEKAPTCRLVVVDLPGYGQNSLHQWGVEISKYLQRRAKGAVLLVDAEVGLKDADRDVLKMLRDFKVKTMVVLTKGDKLMMKPKFSMTGNTGFDKVCVDIWKELRGVELLNGTWTEGDGWEREIWVTGAGGRSTVTSLGIEAARWAFCKLAGLMEDPREATGQPASVPVDDVVSFDDIVWTKTPEKKKSRVTSFKDMALATAPEKRKSRVTSFKDMSLAMAQTRTRVPRRRPEKALF